MPMIDMSVEELFQYRGCTPSTQFAAYNKITAPKSVLFYPDYGHEWLRDHDDIVFQFMRELKK